MHDVIINKLEKIKNNISLRANIQTRSVCNVLLPLGLQYIDSKMNVYIFLIEFSLHQKISISHIPYRMFLLLLYNK